MWDSEINHILSSDVSTKRMFVGCFPRDDLPDLKSFSKPLLLVINLDRKIGRGTHWTALHLSVKGEATYFDSYGLGVNHESIFTFVKKHCQGRVMYSARRLQGDHTLTCGFYVIHFCLAKARGATLKQLLSPFDSARLELNDRKVIDLVRSRLRRSLQTSDRKLWGI